MTRQYGRRVAILGGNRIPFARANGPYARVSNQDMLTTALEGLVHRFGLAGEQVGEVVGGAVLKHSNDHNLTRESVLGTSLAPTTPAFDVQQACATSLQATVLVANKIALGQIDSAIAAGTDSASDAPACREPGAGAGLRPAGAGPQQRRPGARGRRVAADRPCPGADEGRGAAHRAVDGPAHGGHGERLGDHPRGPGPARCRRATSGSPRHTTEASSTTSSPPTWG